MAGVGAWAVIAIDVTGRPLKGLGRVKPSQQSQYSHSPEPRVSVTESGNRAATPRVRKLRPLSETLCVAPLRDWWSEGAAATERVSPFRF